MEKGLRKDIKNEHWQSRTERVIKVYRCVLFNVKMKPLQIKILIRSDFLKKRYCGRHHLLGPQLRKKGFCMWLVRVC